MRVAIIGGGGDLPDQVRHALIERGDTPFCVSVASGAFQLNADLSLPLSRAGQILKRLKDEQVTDLVMIGALKRPAWPDLAMDGWTLGFFVKHASKLLGDDGLLKAMRAELEGQGFRIRAVQDILPDILAGSGVFTRTAPTDADRMVIERGRDIARALGAVDIGQAVVCQGDLVLGVEAAEGTDELIRRCGDMKRAGRGPVLVKISKPGQDTALDLPTIGPETVALCARMGFAGIAVETNKTIIVRLDDVCRQADAAGLFIMGIAAP